MSFAFPTAFRFFSYVQKTWEKRNIFNVLADNYYRVAYTHNLVAAAKSVDGIVKDLTLAEIGMLIHDEGAALLYRNRETPEGYEHRVSYRGYQFIATTDEPCDHLENL